MGAAAEHWQRVYDDHEAQFGADAANGGKKFGSQLRGINLLDRLVLTEVEDPNVFKTYLAGGLLNPVKPVETKAYKSLEETLVATGTIRHRPHSHLDARHSFISGYPYKIQ